MKFLFNNNWSLLVFVLLTTIQVGCEKAEIAPPNQEVAFVKYFGHVVNQEAADLKRTTDGGYLLLGSTTSYTMGNKRDMYLIKTDALGNEEWSKTFGIPILTTKTYDDEGVKIVVLPDDGGYVIAGNRTEYDGIAFVNTKIVLYQLDLEGTVVLGPVTLRESSTELRYSETISDIKIHVDTVAGATFYVLTGSTTNIRINKPGGVKPTDKLDILTMRLDDQFNSLWDQLGAGSQALAYGFDGNDYGTSIHVFSDGYVVIGIDQQSSNNLKKNIRMVKYGYLSSATVYTRNYGGSDYDVEGGYSYIDKTNQRITIYGHVNDGGSTSAKGDLVVLQTDYSFNLQTVNPDDAVYGFRFYGNSGAFLSQLSTSGYTYNKLTSNAISLITPNDGYILSFTNTQVGGLDSEVGLLKLDKDLNVENNWPYVFGYQDESGLYGTLDKGATVIPVIETIEGTAQTKITGYSFTGTFGLDPNTMIGLIKINEKGTLEPQ